MDAIDEKLVSLLEKDARTPSNALAKKLRVSEGTVRNRVQRLLDSKAVARFTIDRGGFGFTALTLLKTSPDVPTEKTARKLLQLDGVNKVDELAGDWDVACRISVSSAQQFNDVIEKIRALNDVIETRSLVVLKTH